MSLRLLVTECATRLLTSYRGTSWPARIGAAVALSSVSIVLLLLIFRSEAQSVFDEQGRLVQGGTVTQAVTTGEFEVIYPQPYAAPPQLNWAYKPLGCKWIQKRADGFRFEITLRGAHDLPPRWVAKGVAADSSS